MEDKLETLDLSGLESNTLNLSGIELNTSGLESNTPNLSGIESNTLVSDPSEAEKLGAETNQSNSLAAEGGPEVDVRYGKNLVYLRKSKAILESYMRKLKKLLEIKI
jgi:hypothetical protein